MNANGDFSFLLVETMAGDGIVIDLTQDQSR